MKKLLIAGLAVFAVAACSNDKGALNERPQPPHHQHQNSEIDAALKACHESVDKTAKGKTVKGKTAKGKKAKPDHSAIDTCMEQKGFKKPADHPNGAPQGATPTQK